MAAQCSSTRGARRSTVRVAGEERWIAAEDAARYRDALGVALPAGVPAALLEPSADAARGAGRALGAHARAVHRRRARAGARFGLLARADRAGAARARARGQLVRGEFRPGGIGADCCDPEVLRQLRRRTLAKLRARSRRSTRRVLARFLPRWHGLDQPRARDRRGCARRSRSSRASRCRSPSSSAHPAGARSRLPPAHARRARRLGRAGVGRRRRARQRGRPRRALAPRSRASLLATVEPPSSASCRAPCTRDPRSISARARRVASSRSCPTRPSARRDEVAARAVGSRVGRPRHERHVRAAALARRAPVARAARGAARSPAGGAGRRVTLGARRDAGATRRARTRARAARALGHRRAARRRAAEELPGGFAAVSRRAARDGGRGHGAARLLRRGLRGRAVRARRRRRSAARRARPDGDGGRGGDVVGDRSGQSLRRAACRGRRPARVARARGAGAQSVVLAHGEPVFFVERGGKKLRLLARDRRDARRAGAGGAQADRGGAAPPRSCASRRSTACRRCTRRTWRCSSAAGSASSRARWCLSADDDARGRQHPRARRRAAALVGEPLDGGVVAARSRCAGCAARAVARVEAVGKHLVSRSTRAAPCACTSASPAGGGIARAHRRATSGAGRAGAADRARRRGSCNARARIEWTRARFAAGARALTRLGPDLLGGRARSRRGHGAGAPAEHAARPIGELLLDQTIAAGLGNVYKCELLFLHGVHPWAASTAIDDATLRALFADGMKWLRANVGRTRTTTADLVARRATGPRTRPALGLRTLAPRLLPLRQRHPAATQRPSLRPTYWCPRCQPERSSGASAS